MVVDVDIAVGLLAEMDELCFVLLSASFPASGMWRRDCPLKLAQHQSMGLPLDGNTRIERRRTSHCCTVM